MPLKNLVAAALIAVACSPLAGAYASERRPFSIAFHGIESDLPIISTTIMPGGTMRVQAMADARADAGALTQDKGEWVWTAPREPGRATLQFFKGDQDITLNVFILTPFENGVQKDLNGYKIGAYSKTAYRGLQSYSAPRGFIDLASGPRDLKISPHFTLGQFICKQQPGHDPTYLLIRPGMLLKLETLLEAANDNGWDADTFTVMSGFRTPFYNASIGNVTTSSRHLFGGAADIYIDQDGDGVMDDLDGDGKITKDDARALAKLAERLAQTGGANWPAGGIGVYGSNAAHGPFVHIDARGYRARWGQ